MSDKLSEILNCTHKLKALLEGQRDEVMLTGTAALEARWAAAMTETWRAIPEHVRLRSTSSDDPLAPTHTEKRLPRAAQLLAAMSLVGEGFVEERATGDVYLDLGSAYMPNEHYQVRLLRLHKYSDADAHVRTEAEMQAVLAYRVSEFRSNFFRVSL